MKSPVIIYSDLECLLEKRSTCQNNLEKSYTEKNMSIHPLVIWCLCNVRLIQQNKLDCYRDKDCMKKFCKDLKEHAKK